MKNIMYKSVKHIQCRSVGRMVFKPVMCMDNDIIKNKHEIIERLKSSFRMSNVEKRYLQGHEIYEWVTGKWKRFLHVELIQRGSRMFLEVTPDIVKANDVAAEFIALDEIADKLTEWYMIECVENGIDEYRDISLPTHMPVRKSIYIPLDIYNNDV